MLTAATAERYHSRRLAPQLVLDVVEQVLRVADELALRVKGKTGTEALSGTFVQRLCVCFVARPPARFMRSELIQPSERIPEAGVVGADGDGALDQVQALAIAAAAGDERGGEVFDRFDVGGIEFEGAPGEFGGGGVVVLRLALLRLSQQVVRFGARVAQRSPSISCNASGSLKTRNEFVRTFPWLLTAREMRVIVSSSGASAITT